MCGIIGIVGTERQVAPLLIEALRRLEYRGYDSAGVAVLRGGQIARRRAMGKIAALAARLEAEPLAGTTGIGHTRWATHGVPSEDNAHPHRVGPVALVHNGIIENAQELRVEAKTAGWIPTSETDTEVVAALVAQAMARGLAPLDAVAATLPRLRGAYALCFVFEGFQDLMVCARLGPPLVIGHGEGEMYVGSDALALASLTRRIAFLEEGDYAAVTHSDAHVFDASGMPVHRPIRNMSIDAADVDKDGRRHFMAKEIHEQPAVAARALAAAVAADRTAGIDWPALRRVSMVACGTAFYACMVARYWFEQFARVPVDVDVASEFRYRAPPFEAGGLCVFVSQSGETADTLAALRLAKAAGQTTAAVVNVEESSIAREADVVLPTCAGREIGVASTKAFLAQLITLAEMALRAGLARGALDPAAHAARLADLARVPGAVADALMLEPAIAEAASEIAEAQDVLFIGRGVMHPMAMEGALKLKELTYRHAEGYAAGELEHGPIALVDAATPVVALAPHGPLFDKTASNLAEVMARHGKVLLITDAAGAAEAPATWRQLVLPTVPDIAAPIVAAVAVQLLAYHAALALGTDVDQPRNLAKSVTVE